MRTVPVTLALPEQLWHAVQSLAPHEGDAPKVILRAVEEHVVATARNQTQKPGKYRDLVQALSLPVADLHLSARPATALHLMGIRYVYELVALEPRALRMRQNFGEKSLREVKEKLAAVGLTLGMTLEDDTCQAAVVSAVAATIAAADGGAA